MNQSKSSFCTICKERSMSINKNGIKCQFFQLLADGYNHCYCMPCFYDLFYETKQKNRIVKNDKTYIKCPCGCFFSEYKLSLILNQYCIICGIQQQKQQDQIIFHNDGRFYCRSCQKRMKQKSNIFKCLPKMTVIIQNCIKQNLKIQKGIIKKQSLQSNNQKNIQEQQLKMEPKINKELKIKQQENKTKQQQFKNKYDPLNKLQKTQQKLLQRKQSNISTGSQTQLTSPKLGTVNRMSVNCFSCKQSSNYEINNKKYYFQFYKDAREHYHCLPCLYKEYQNKQNVIRGPYYNKPITAKVMQCKCSIQISMLENKLKTRCFVCGVKQPKQKTNLNSDRFYCNKCKENILLNLLNHNMLDFILTQIQKFQKEKLKQKLQEHQQIFQQPCNREDQFQSQKNQLKSSNKNTKTKPKTFAIDDQENVKRIGDVPIPKLSKHLQDLQAFLNQSQTFIQNLNNQKQTKPIYLDLSLISWNEDDPDYSQVFNLKQKPVIFQKINKVRYRCQNLNCKQFTDYKAFDKMCKNCFYKDIFQGTNFKFKEIQNTLSKSKSGFLQNQFENIKNDQTYMKTAKIRPNANKSEFF